MFRAPLVCLWTTTATSATIAVLDAANGTADDARGLIISSGIAAVTFIAAIILHSVRAVLADGAETRRQAEAMGVQVEALREWVESKMDLDESGRPPAPHEPPPSEAREPAPVIPIRMSRRGRPAIAGIRHGAAVDEGGIWAAIDRAQHGDAS
jgi:hypothetical protein